ncbi:protein far1-related sequence 4, partial [Nicotiana attenuata]
NSKYSKRVNCEARVNCKALSENLWCVILVNNLHSHELFPDLSYVMAAHRHVPLSLQRPLEANNRASAKICTNFRTIEVLSGVPQEMRCTANDCTNFIITSMKGLTKDGDTKLTLIFFLSSSKQENDGFFHSIELDAQGRLKNVIWIHPQDKAGYGDFTDVISFYTTYLVSGYNMLYVAFVRVS